MKNALKFWVVGCLLFGLAFGAHRAACPNEPETPSLDVIATVAVWPAAFSYMVGYLLAGGHTKPTTCKVAP